MAKVVSLTDVARMVRAGARVRKPKPPAPPPPVDVEELVRRAAALVPPPPAATVDLDGLAARAAAMVQIPPPPPPPQIPASADVEDVTYDERGRLRIKLRGGKTFEVRIAGTTTVVQSGLTDEQVLDLIQQNQRQEVFILSTPSDLSPSPGYPCVAFRPTGVAGQYTMEVIDG